MIFLVEMLLKIIGLGCTSYLKDTANILDMIIVILSTIDITFFIIMSHNGHKSGSGIGVQVSRIFRIFRLIRVFKLSN